jgi:hypothetical protein
VRDNRRLYRREVRRRDAADRRAPRDGRPDAGFYLWARTPIADTEFARGLQREYNVTVLPGSYLAREAGGINPGADFVRIALVASSTNASRRRSGSTNRSTLQETIRGVKGIIGPCRIISRSSSRPGKTAPPSARQGAGQGRRSGRAGPRPARPGQAARRREDRRPMDHPPVGQEGGAALLPPRRQRVMDGGPALLGQGADQVRQSTTPSNSSAAASASCRRAVVRRGSATSAATWC